MIHKHTCEVCGIVVWARDSDTMEEEWREGSVLCINRTLTKEIVKPFCEEHAPECAKELGAFHECVCDNNPVDLGGFEDLGY